MDGERWFRAYVRTFFPALALTVLWQLYRISGFGPELADRVMSRLPGSFDLNLWLSRIGAFAYVLTLAAGVAILVSLASRAYSWLGERRADDD